MDRFPRWAAALDWLWFLAWVFASVWWCVTASNELGATFDEPTYVTDGLDCWRTHSHRYMPWGTMPLPVDVLSLPLHAWESWRGQPFDGLADLDQLLPVARRMTLGWWVLLLIYGRLAGRSLAGPWGGRLAVALLAGEPLLLAHASLATTDIAFTACMVALVYHFRTGRKSTWVQRVALPAFWLGAALAAKASAVVFAPLCLLAVEAERWLRAYQDRAKSPADSDVAIPRLRHSAVDFFLITCVGVLLACFYCGHARDPVHPYTPAQFGLPEGWPSQVVVWVGEHIRSARRFVDPISGQIQRNSAPSGVWYYWFRAFSIKLSLFLLCLPLLVGIVHLRSLLNWAVMAGTVLLLFSPLYRVQVGPRLALPLVGLLAIGLAAAVVSALQSERRRWVRVLLGSAVAIGVTWTTASAIEVWPDALCYTNELWGGTEQGYPYLADSAYDWGQGLKALARWQREHQLPSIHVWYFGNDPAIHRLPFHGIDLSGCRSEEDVRSLVQGRYLAVGTSQYSAYAGSVAVRFLQARPAIGRTATFFIYDFSADHSQGFATKCW